MKAEYIDVDCSIVLNAPWSHAADQTQWLSEPSPRNGMGDQLVFNTTLRWLAL